MNSTNKICFWTKTSETPASALPPFEHIIDKDKEKKEEVPLSHHTYRRVLFSALS